MRPLPQFCSLPGEFWANVRALSETLGYSKRGADQVRCFSGAEVSEGLAKLGLSTDAMKSIAFRKRELGALLLDYLNARAVLLNDQVEPLFMDRSQAKAEFDRLRKLHQPNCLIPMNKQKGKKRHPAYFTAIANILTEATLGESLFDDNPRGLVTITENGYFTGTLSRWMDGAYPAVRNPIAIWEVKEYYGTTTFGSRVADGVYETMLDGYELAELNQRRNERILHYLLLDDRFTWWKGGKSYLCRIVDMMHMGLVDEVIFGREILTRWPEIVASWPVVKSTTK